MNINNFLKLFRSILNILADFLLFEYNFMFSDNKSVNILVSNTQIFHPIFGVLNQGYFQDFFKPVNKSGSFANKFNSETSVVYLC